MNGKDFARIHFAAHHTLKGIIICNESADYEKRAKEIEETLKANKPLVGTLIYIPPKREPIELSFSVPVLPRRT